MQKYQKISVFCKKDMHTENNSWWAENNWWSKGKVGSMIGKHILSRVTISKELQAIFCFDNQKYRSSTINQNFTL